MSLNDAINQTAGIPLFWSQFGGWKYGRSDRDDYFGSGMTAQQAYDSLSAEDRAKVDATRLIAPVDRALAGYHE